MDPFTQKLLQRTQARKEQLAKKREELAAYRATKNPTDRDNQRRPLSDDNKDNKPTNTEERKRIKIDSETCTKDTQREKVKNAPEIDANSPSIKARKERLIQMQQKAKENAPTPKKHWKQLDLGGGKERSSSPSVAARSAAFETKTADQDKALQGQEPVLPLTPRKLSGARDIFEKRTQPPAAQSQADKAAKKDSTAPPKPPRLAEGNTKRADEKKRKAPSPPVSETSDSDASCSDKSAGQQVTKRKAPSPPSKENDSGSDEKMQKVGSGVSSDRVSSDSEKGKKPKPQKSKNEGSGNTTVVICKASTDCSDQPTPKPRKRLQVTEQNSSDAMEAKANTKPEEKRGKDDREGPARKAKKSDVIFASAQVVDGGVEQRVEKKAPKKQGHETVVVQACVVDPSESQSNRQSTTTVKAVSCEDQPRAAPVRAKVTRISPGKNESSRVEKVPNATALTEEKTATKDRKAKNQTKWDSHPFKPPASKRSERSQHKVPEKHWDDCMTDLNETVNLNDVNIHEITFNFDFSKFDEEFNENKEGFKMSYEERCKKLEQERQTTPGPNLDGNNSVPPSPGVVTVKEKGVHTSGYNSIASELYATKAKSPSRRQSPTEKKQTDTEKIKMMLEKAAFQQNIVLQASRAVNLCAATNDVHLGNGGEVEAERVLLLATERRQSCLNEVQRLKTNPSGAVPEFMDTDGCDGAAMPCQATVSLEGIQLPLKQEFMDTLCNGIRSDLGIFYFVCIVEQGPDQVFCSRVQSTTDATEGAFLKFPDKFVLENVKPNFVVTLKIFAMNVKRVPVNATLTPKHKIFQSPKVIKNKLSGRRGLDQATSGPPASPRTVFRTSSFSLVGVTHVTLPLVNSKKLTLDKVPEHCPANNYLQMNIQCIPMYTSHVKGFLTILEDIGGYGAWQRRWCTLESGLLQYWRYPGDETTKAPMGCLDLGQCVSNTVTTVSRDLCARPNTMELKVTRSKGEGSTEVKYLLAADTKPDRSTWLNSLNDALKDFRAWNPKPLYPKLGHLFNQDVYMCSDKSPQKQTE